MTEDEKHDEWLKKHLVCPRDHAHLKFNLHEVKCPFGHVYPRVDGIPVMLLKEATQIHHGFSSTFREINSENKGDEAVPPTEIDPHVQKDIQGTCGSMYKNLKHRLKRYPIPNLPLPQSAGGEYFLDIGCNWGRWCISAANKGYKAIGIDPWLSAVQAARRVSRQLEIPSQYVVADARFLPFAERSFDVVHSYSVLQHFDVDDTLATLSQIARVLKPGGTSLIQMANRLGVRNLYQQCRRKFKAPEAFFEIRYWNPFKLKQTFQQFIGPSSFFADGFFTLNPQLTDLDLLPPFYRMIVRSSELLRRQSERIPFLKYMADSLYVRSKRLAGKAQT